MNDKPQQKPDRSPIPIARLLLCTPNPHGATVPYGNNNASTKMFTMIDAGEHGDVRTVIEWRPWMRMYFVIQTQKIDRTGGGVEWRPKGRPYMVPETLAVAQLGEE